MPPNGPTEITWLATTEGTWALQGTMGWILGRSQNSLEGKDPSIPLYTPLFPTVPSTGAAHSRCS